jgi:hypothetical protein
MKTTLGGIFVQSPGLDAFRAAVQALRGDFDFEADALIDLGTAYFDRHPETSHHRDMEAVLLGYALVRVCIIERVVRELSPEGRSFFRAVFQNVAEIGSRMDELLVTTEDLKSISTPPRGESQAPHSGNSEGRKVFLEDFRRVEAELAAVRTTIEEIPKGLIKERFIGGISHLYNVLYVVRRNLRNRGMATGS